MNRSIIGRVLTAFVVTAGLLLGLFATAASAQVVDRVPAAPIQAASDYGAGTQGSASSYGVGAQSSASSYAVGASYYQCGFYRNPYSGWDAFYTHCGSSPFPRIRVSFNYGWSHRDITVLGTANLSSHRDLQGAGFITDAWCISNCW